MSGVKSGVGSAAISARGVKRQRRQLICGQACKFGCHGKSTVQLAHEIHESSALARQTFTHVGPCCQKSELGGIMQSQLDTKSLLGSQIHVPKDAVQRLVNCLDHRDIVSVCSQAR